MPGESIIPVLRERIAALEAWRDEHKLQHDREVQRQESSTTRKVMLIVALIGVAAAIIGGAVGALVSYLLS